MGFEDLDFITIHNVIESWEQLRRSSDDFDEVAGVMLFSNLFDKCPRAKAFFGFPLDMDPGRKSLKQSRRFVAHAKYLISMLDRALNMLGPDAELLTEVMSDLGKKHVKMGITDASYYNVMGESLMLALSDILGKNFTPEMEESWTIVYGELSSAMLAEVDTKDKGEVEC